MAASELRVPSAFLDVGQRKDEDESITSAVRAIEHMCADLGLEDLGMSDVLDVGCGVKFTQALLNHDAYASATSASTCTAR